MPRKYVMKNRVPKEKIPKKLKYNIKYINETNDVLFEGNYYFIKDCLTDLKKVCPMINLRKLRLINEKADYVYSLRNFIKITLIQE